MLIIRHGEIFTKSDPVVREFIRRLVSNIKIALPQSKITSKRWRIYVDVKNEKSAINKLQRVFGISSVSPAFVCGADVDEIKKLLKSKMPKFKGTFAVKTQRISKEFKLTSQQVNEQIGEYVINLTNAKVNLSKPGFTVNLEIYSGKAYLFFETYPGPKGLPLGTTKGKVICDFKDDKDIAASWMIMKRGAVVVDFPLAKWNYVGGVAGDVFAKVTGVTDVADFIKEQNNTELPLFAPLLGMSKNQAQELKQRIL